MRADAQFAVVEAVIKGYHKWVEAHGKTPQRDVCFLNLSTEQELANHFHRSRRGVNWNT